MHELLSLMHVQGCMIAADALRCQKNTAVAIVARQAGCLLHVKDNQVTLKLAIFT